VVAKLLQTISSATIIIIISVEEVLSATMVQYSRCPCYLLSLQAFVANVVIVERSVAKKDHEIPGGRDVPKTPIYQSHYLI